MKRYKVKLREVVWYEMEVEAPDQGAAMELAEDIWNHSEDPSDFSSEGMGVEACECDEVPKLPHYNKLRDGGDTHEEIRYFALHLLASEISAESHKDIMRALDHNGYPRVGNDPIELNDIIAHRVPLDELQVNSE